MDAVEPATSAAAPSCSAASPLGIANLNGNAASAGSGGHDEYPCAAANGGGPSRLQSLPLVAVVAAVGSFGPFPGLVLDAGSRFRGCLGDLHLTIFITFSF
jgi:hypothetical protein